jgi:NAD(P)-dependent dehydrogenase (short-subunit alcohol dehydrogenase family)
MVAKGAMDRGAASVTIVPADLNTHENLEAAISKTISNQAFEGKLDVLVLNHAIQGWGWLLPDELDGGASSSVGNTGKDWSFELLDDQISVNLASYVKLAVMAMPALVRAANSSSSSLAKSRIVAVSSGVSFFLRFSITNTKNESALNLSLTTHFF